MRFNLFCEECGFKLERPDKFCTSCGLFLDRTKEPLTPQVTTPSIEAVNRSKAPSASSEVNAPKLASPSQPPQKVVQSTVMTVAAPRTSFLKIAIFSVLLLAVGAGGAFFVLKGGLFKDSSKPSSGNSSQKKVASNRSSFEVNVTGQMLVDASIKGKADELQDLIQQIKLRPPADTLDRKKARELNDQALKAIRAQDYAGAIELLKNARTADLADAEISNNLGYALRMAEDFKAAERQLIKTIEQFPTRQQAWSDLGETSTKLGKHSQAVAAFVTAHRIAKNPDKLLEKYVKLMESTEDEALKTDLLEATNLINASK
jgi:hypothetical protein